MRIGIHQIDPRDARDGDVPICDTSVAQYVPGDAVLEIVGGSGVSVDNTDPKRPVVSATGGGGGSTETWEDVVAALTGKVHRWKWDDASGATVADAIGALPLTLSGTYTRAAPGLFGAASATTFGASAKAVSSGLGSIPTGNAARCLIVLYRSTAASNVGQTLFSYGPASSTRQWFTGLINNGAANRIDLAVWADDLDSPTPGPPTTGEWRMAAYGYDGAQNLLAYIDGQTFAYRTAAAINTGATGNFQVGLANNGNAQYAGDLEDLIVLNNWPGKRRLDRLNRTLAAL